MNTQATQQVKEIGEWVQFTTDYSSNGCRYLQGKIVGRNWAFEDLLSYEVKTLAGTRYSVNAKTFEGGRPF